MTVVDPHFTAFGRLYDYLPAALLEILSNVVDERGQAAFS